MTQISVQIFRIQNNEVEVEIEINPGREAVQNDHACKLYHGLSSSHEKIVNAITINFVR